MMLKSKKLEKMKLALVELVKQAHMMNIYMTDMRLLTGADTVAFGCSSLTCMTWRQSLGKRSTRFSSPPVVAVVAVALILANFFSKDNSVS